MPAPVLLLADEERRPFNSGPYTAELLQLEGLGWPETLEPRQVSPETLRHAPARILAANTPFGPEQAHALREAVAAGRMLLAFLPSPELAAAFDLEPAYRTDIGGYLRIRVPGFPDEPMQFHGPLRHFRLPEEAETLIEQVDDSKEHRSTGRAAAIRLSVGRGEAIFFLYDLPQSVALTRQGDPRRVSLHSNTVTPGWRAADMFVDHLDCERAHLPQADLQCHLLRHLLTAAKDEYPPMPWLWYFPDGAETVLLVSSDDDWSTRGQFDALLACARRYDVRITFYLVDGTIVTPEMRAAWAAEGHTFSIHPNLKNPPEWTWRETVAAHRQAFRERFGEEPGCSVRNHAIPWVGWVRGGAWMREAGFTWDSNFFTCPPRTRYYMTGSGLPCPLVDLDGTVLRITEQPAQFSDETTLAAGGFPFSLNLGVEEAVEIITGQMRANAVSFHSLLCINTHPVSFATYSQPLWEAVFAFARDKGIPCLALEEWAAFWERRRSVEIRPAEKVGDRWEWKVTALEGVKSIHLLLPAALTRVTWNGVPAVTGGRSVHGRKYVSTVVPPGENILAASELEQREKRSKRC
jgi:hypothetical protein